MRSMGGLNGIKRLLAIVTGMLATGAAWSAPQVEVFTPQGQAKSVRQVAVRFSEPMVAFGDPRLADPFTVKCDGEPERLKGRGRWADQKNWVFDFERDLPAGVRCSFRVKQDLTTLSGAAVEPQQFSFSTGGPAVIEQMPWRDAQVDEEQVFILGLDAPVKEDTVRAHAWCDARGIAERIGPTTGIQA